MSDVAGDIMKEADEVFGQAEDILTFRKLLGKSIIRIIYWAGAAVYAIGALVLLIWALDEDVPFLAGLAVAIGVASNVAWRLVCELWMLLFYMHDRLISIDKTLKEKSG